MKNSWIHLGARVAYDGRNFSGMQRQQKHRSIQEELEEAFSKILRKKIKIQFSSRTDTGVHAMDQWISVPNELKTWEALGDAQKARFLLALNAVLPDSIRIWQLLKLRSDFRPSKSPEWKEYHYHLIQGPTVDPLQFDRALWIRSELDWGAMRKSFKKFEGLHDFASFSKRAKRYGDETRRNILRAEIRIRAHPQMKSLKEVCFVVRGSGFLYNMVRTMVGTVIEIGRGRHHDIDALLQSRRRSDAGVNAPASPLFLIETRVPKPLWQVIGSHIASKAFSSL